MLAEIVKRRRRAGRAAFIPYITAGDPSLEQTKRMIETLADAGADVVELGVPFSDPIADGPVIQRASERALKAKTTLPKILTFVSALRRRGDKTPIVLFSYFNPILKMGVRNFAASAKKAGVDGVLVVDLPPEEAEDYRALMRDRGLETIFLASPTTDDARLKLIDRASTGFVYYVSRLGVTGARADVSKSLKSEIRRVRRSVRRPIAIGFGISTPAQARRVAHIGDAVVVGSALVACGENQKPPAALARVRRLARSIVNALGRD